MSAWGIRDFRLLWSGRAVSLLGSWLLVVAVPAHVHALTGSLLATGLTLAAEYLPALLLGPVAGVLTDRWDRRRVMITADLFRAGAVAFMLLGTPAAIYAAVIAESVGAVLFRPAAQAHVPAVVGVGKALTSANSWNAGVDGVVRLVAPPLGAALFAWAGFPALVLVDVASYLVSALAIGLTAPRLSPVAARPGLRAGLRVLGESPMARALLPLTALFLGANAALTALLVPFGVQRLGGVTQIGLVVSALGVGFLLGAVAVRLLHGVQPRVVLCGAQLATAAGFAVLFGSRSLVIALPAAVAIGLFGSVTLITPQTALQTVAPNGFLGRISAVFLAAEALATLLGAVSGPLLAESVSLSFAAWLAVTVTALGAVSGAVTVPRVMLAPKRSNEQDDSCASPATPADSASSLSSSHGARSG